VSNRRLERDLKSRLLEAKEKHDRQIDSARQLESVGEKAKATNCHLDDRPHELVNDPSSENASMEELPAAGKKRSVSESRDATKREDLDKLKASRKFLRRVQGPEKSETKTMSRQVRRALIRREEGKTNLVLGKWSSGFPLDA